MTLFCLANDLISIIHKHECCVHNVLVLNLVELKIQRPVWAKFVLYVVFEKKVHMV